MVSISNFRNRSNMVNGIKINKKKQIKLLPRNRKALDSSPDVLYNRVAMAPVAQNISAGQTRGGSLRFKECERIDTVEGSVAFSVNGSIACNPGLATSFPWLSGHANLFERYRIHKLVYRYKNLKGTASNGNILMSFDYDTLDSAPATAIEMTQSTVYADGAPWRIFELVVPSDKRDLFTRSGDVAGSDLKTYDMGKLHIAAEGCADTSPHGYLEVEYDVELFMKQSISSGTGPATVGSSVTVSSTGALTENTVGATSVGAVVSAPAGKYLVTLTGVAPGALNGVDASFAGVVITGGQATVNGTYTVTRTQVVVLASAGVIGTMVPGNKTSVQATMVRIL